jgi:hypothetical protein
MLAALPWTLVQSLKICGSQPQQNPAVQVRLRPVRYSAFILPNFGRKTSRLIKRRSTGSSERHKYIGGDTW